MGKSKDLANGETRFANVAGDTFTGDLIVNGELLIGTSTAPSGSSIHTVINSVGGSGGGGIQLTQNNNGGSAIDALSGGGTRFYTFTGAVGSESYTEAMRLNSEGSILHGSTNTNPAGNNVNGFSVNGSGSGSHGRISANVTSGDWHRLGRSADGAVVGLYSAGGLEGTISISGTTTSYNGGHLARWSRLTNGNKDTSIVKGTVLTNLDEMVVWSYDAVEGRGAYTEDNEQLNCMAVSSVEGDPNVAGVFVNWDDDDDFNDMNVAMTGDMVIRIAQGTTVARGDLLMSAGDGTAKPQDDDIVRSKTIAKVTSTNVSHTYDDGSYLVPCVLMAC